jgi:hypothetical protein
MEPTRKDFAAHYLPGIREKLFRTFDKFDVSVPELMFVRTYIKDFDHREDIRSDAHRWLTLALHSIKREGKSKQVKTSFFSSKVIIAFSPGVQSLIDHLSLDIAALEQLQPPVHKGEYYLSEEDLQDD